MAASEQEAGAEPDPELRASQVFEAWLLRESEGKGVPFDELVEQHPDLQKSLERMRRMNALLQGVLQAAAPAGRGEEDRSRTLGDYRIVREIARGAMGIVFEAEQISLHRRVALKVLPAQLTLDSRALVRFQREAEISARLNHRNIISIIQIGEVAGVHFIAMELVEGSSLDRVIERMRRESFEEGRRKRVSEVVSMQTLDEDSPALGGQGDREDRSSRTKRGSSASNKNYIETALRLVCQVAEALDHAHQAGVIHRDVKPSNILVRPDGTPVLTDFGLAREEGLPAVSMTGDFAGTPHYVSPEQAMSGRMTVDHRADVFSLGATLYELLTLELPFPGTTLHEVLQKIVTKQPRDPASLNPSLAPDLVTILLKALEKDPDRRYPSAGALAEDLRAFLEYRPIQARRTPTVLRALRWLRREPMKAGLVVTLAVGVPLLAFLAREAYTANDLLAANRPAMEEAELRRVFLDLGLGRHDRAEQGFRGYLARIPDDEEAMAGLVLALLSQERSAEALAEIDRFEASFGPSGAARRLCVDALRMEGREAEAAEIEAELPEPATAPEEYVEAQRLLRGVGFGLVSEQRDPTMNGRDTLVESRRRAREAVQWLLRANQGNERAAYAFALAGACWVAGDEEKARLAADTILRKWRNEALAWFYVGLAREVFDEESAIEAFREAGRMDPDLMEARERAAILLLSRDAQRGVEELQALAEAHPDQAEFSANLAAALYQLGRFTEAVESAARAVELEPRMVTALDTLGSARLQLGAFGPAVEALERAVELEPRGARLHNDLGWALWRLGRKEEALEHLETAHELDPDGALPLLNLGLAAVEDGRPEEASTHLEQAIQRNDAHPRADFPEDMAWKGIGVACAQLGRHEEKLEAFEEAYRLAPGDAGHALNFGASLHEAGRHAEAVPLLELALSRGVGDESAHKALVGSLTASGDRSAALHAARRWTARFENSVEAWNDRAWLQVDPDGDSSLRDSEDALRAAERAVGLSRGQAPGILDTLAWALLWAGRPEDALAKEREAIERARSNQLGDLASELERGLLRMQELASSMR